MARRSQSPIEDAIDLASKLPWWAGATLALISYLLLHWYATQEISPAAGLNDMVKLARSGLLHGFAVFGQYILPGVFLIGALVSAFNRFKREKIYDTSSRITYGNFLEDMSWQDFELLVGEHFRRQGYRVEETSGGADGGIDLIVIRNGEKYLVQCKQWKAYKVGVKIVRELLGVMVGAGAAGGFVVTSGEFTRDAISFAHANNIELLDGEALRRMMKVQAEQTDSVVERSSRQVLQPNNAFQKPGESQPICPKCGNSMVLRVAKKGNKVGEKFWGCSKYPACRTILPIN